MPMQTRRDWPPMRWIVLLLIATTLAGCASDTPLVTDSDGDGYDDDTEIAAGSDPYNATSVPVVVEPVPAVQWPAWGDLASATIRPGASLGGFCTFNFLYEAPNGTGYIGTAAHCTDIGDRVTIPGTGEIGTVVYDSDDHGSGVDFSLIQLDDDAISKAHPQMFGFVGPTGYMNVSDLAVGDLIHLHGYGVVLGQNDVTRDRSGVLVDWNEDEYNVDMPAVNGDSGSALLHDSGKAFGIISRYGIANTPPSTDQGPLMPYIFRELEKAGFGDVRLATI